MMTWDEMQTKQSVPRNWETECDTCLRFLSRYEKRDLFLYVSKFSDTLHCMANEDAVEREMEEDGDSQWEDYGSVPLSSEYEEATAP